MTLTIAEEVLLLAYREDTGKPVIGSVELDAALAGAVVAELAVSRRVDFDDKKLVVTDDAPLGDEELDQALARISGESRRHKADWWVGRLRMGGLRKRLLTRLAVRGVLSEQTGKILGIFPTTRYPELDPSHERAVRDRVRNVLAGAQPDERTAALIAVVHAAKLDREAFPDAPKGRVKEIAQGEWAGEAVQKTIASVHAAVIAATTAATTAATIT
ncbi:GPP34 family phosphoprotein [Microbispora sp. NBC_01189]|uniref:GOLPH3/VPS74 family protein n=1 Tax=Microbispora sp. NBC_01189 TaxID=2903583 RepID=UPI002E120B17|nr:GPP34 family phosphoprotein [Microbispora sp. NBC_01189]